MFISTRTSVTDYCVATSLQSVIDIHLTDKGRLLAFQGDLVFIFEQCTFKHFTTDSQKLSLKAQVIRFLDPVPNSIVSNVFRFGLEL